MKIQITLIILMLIILLTSCQQAPTVQPWEQTVAVNTPSNTTKANDTAKTSPIPSSTSATKPTITPNVTLLSPRDCTLKELKVTTPETVQLDIKGKDRLVHLNSNVSLITGQSENFPILSAKPRIYDWEKIGIMVYGDKFDEAYKYNEEVKDEMKKKDATIGKDNHYFRYKGHFLNVSNDNRSISESYMLPKWDAMTVMPITDDKSTYTTFKEVDNGVCDQLKLTKEEAIKKVVDFIKKYDFPIDYDHPRVTACEQKNNKGIVQYYTIKYSYAYKGMLIDSIGRNFTGDTPWLDGGEVTVELNDEGIRGAGAYNCLEFTEVQNNVKIISIEKAIESFKKYVDYINPTDISKEISYNKIHFNYIGLPKKGSMTEVLYYPVWTFMSDTYRQYDVLVNAVDGSIISTIGDKK